MTKQPPKLSKSTQLNAMGLNQDETHGSVVSPLYLSTNYRFSGLGEKGTYDYARSNNPNRNALAEVLAMLEGGQGCVLTSSGLSALDLVWQDLKQSKRVVVPHDCYGGTQRLLNARAKQGLIELIYVDQADQAALTQALEAPVGLLLIETPSNPLMRIVDLETTIALGHKAGAKVCVDNTFLSPALQNPIEFGADYVVHSTTKYINGHSDVIGGAVICHNGEDADTLRWWANALGSTPGAFDNYMALRGVRTLFVRIEQQQNSAQMIADFLLAHPKIAKVYYPGLSNHAGYEIAKRQQKGFGGMMSFELKGGLSEVQSLFAHISIFTLAESLGGVESLIVHPSSMTHAAMSDEAKRHAGISDSLIRLSIGLEDSSNLIEALSQALDRV